MIGNHGNIVDPTDLTRFPIDKAFSCNAIMVHKDPLPSAAGHLHK